MKWLRRLGIFFILFLILLAVLLPRINRVQREGTLSLKGLSAPVTVIRDEKGMPYLYAGNITDLITAQGFVMAQERLFQMELTKLLARGRISELAGEKGKSTDIRMRTIGFYRHAVEQVKILSPGARRFIHDYIRGINAFIRDYGDNHHLEFSLAGIKPEAWQPEDVVAILYLMGWNSAGNLKSEIISQMLIEKLGPEQFRKITPFSTNPDNPGKATALDFPPEKSGIAFDEKILSLLDFFGPLRVGSNNWVLSAQRSPGDKPMLVNDPHLDSRMIPGPFMAMGLVTPKMRAVGACVPGIPGFIVGRTGNCAVGVTNSYHDAQDLYIEKIDPNNRDHYFERGRSLPFTRRVEKLRIKNKKAPGGFREESITILSTRRGPVVSKILKNLKTERVLTLRWSPFETKIPEIGFDRFLTAQNAKEMRAALRDVRHVMLNCVYADKEGNIGWTTTGRIPLRTRGTGSIPTPASQGDNWKGFIPFEKVPAGFNPGRGWLGTCNHNTIPKGYPHYISSYFSPHYRYSRLIELMDTHKKPTEGDHWKFMRDTRNLMAVTTLPLILKILRTDKRFASMASLLEKWDRHDGRDSAGALCYQVLYYNIYRETFHDEMGRELLDRVIKVQYFWQERFEKMLREGKSSFFDNITTKKREVMADCILSAAETSLKELIETGGSDPDDWRWGEVHRIEFFNPIGRSGILKKLLGRSFEMGGSHQTLYRAIYSPAKPFSVDVSAALRMVVDLSNDERVLAVLPSGTTGRTFDTHTGDQMEAYMSGEKRYWWFSDKMITAHKKYSMKIIPGR